MEGYIVWPGWLDLWINFVAKDPDPSEGDYSVKRLVLK
jgi:hypothetical protein